MAATLDRARTRVKPGDRLPLSSGSSGSGSRSGRRPPTIIDVALRAGVSKSVVSRVLRDDPAVSAGRREQVLSAAGALGYRPNAVARSLVQRRTFNVGVIVSDLHNLFFAEILDGIAAAAATAGYNVLITTSRLDRAAEATAVETLLQLRTDGIILAGSLLSAASVRAAGRVVPVALVTSDIRAPGVDSVATDDARGAGLAVEHLVGLGHCRIAMVDGGIGAGASARRRGYEASMRRFGLDGYIQVAPGDYTEDGGWRGAQRLLAGQSSPTAIFAANDLAAIGALKAIADSGFEVPRQVSVVGYDNTALAALRHVSLTTVHQPRFQIGEMAMTALLRRLHRPSARTRRDLLAPSLVIRHTTAPPPSTD